LVSERSEQDAESETQSNAEENHNTDMDEEHDVDVDEDVKKEEADNEGGAPTQVTDKKPVVLMPEPVTDDVQVEVKVKDEAEEEAKPQAEVHVFVLCPFFCIVTKCVLHKSINLQVFGNEVQRRVFRTTDYRYIN
jgi:hypothetical protein